MITVNTKEYIRDKEVVFNVLKNEIYIEPITACNLKCKMCYVNTINGKNEKELEEERILSFVEKLAQFNDNEAIKIDWCGTGEVSLYSPLTRVINALNERYRGRIEHLIITNGIIDRLSEIHDLSNVSFNVSIDGLETHHDWNRGKGMYRKSLEFCKSANKHGCKSIQVNSLLMKRNLDTILQFNDEMKKELGQNLTVMFLIPLTNNLIRSMLNASTTPKIDNSNILTYQQLKDFFDDAPPEVKNLMRYDKAVIDLYLSLTPRGLFYCCCEDEIMLGDLNDDISTLMRKLENSIDQCKRCPLFDSYCSLVL